MIYQLEKTEKIQTLFQELECDFAFDEGWTDIVLAMTGTQSTSLHDTQEWKSVLARLERKSYNDL